MHALIFLKSSRLMLERQAERGILKLQSVKHQQGLGILGHPPPDRVLITIFTEVVESLGLGY